MKSIVVVCMYFAATLYHFDIQNTLLVRRMKVLEIPILPFAFLMLCTNQGPYFSESAFFSGKGP